MVYIQVIQVLVLNSSCNSLFRYSVIPLFRYSASLSVLCVVVVAHVHSCCFSVIGVNDYYIQLLHSCCFSVIVVMCLSVVICNAYKRPLYVVHTPIVI